MSATTAATGITTCTSVNGIATAIVNTSNQYYWNTVANTTLSATINTADATTTTAVAATTTVTTTTYTAAVFAG